jgi:uncharacterized membrane protein (DUF2068 family)
MNPRRDRSTIVVLIGIFRLFKAFLLLLGGAASLGLMSPETGARIREWLTSIPYADDHLWLRHLIGMVAGMDEKRAMIVAIAAFSYAALFIVEGTGLILGRPWAEWVTVIATASLVPFEVFELMRRASVAKGILLIVNIAIVIYLVWRIRSRERGERGEGKPRTSGTDGTDGTDGTNGIHRSHSAR